MLLDEEEEPDADPDNSLVKVLASFHTDWDPVKPHWLYVTPEPVVVPVFESVSVVALVAVPVVMLVVSVPVVAVPVVPVVVGVHQTVVWVLVAVLVAAVLVSAVVAVLRVCSVAVSRICVLVWVFWVFFSVASVVPAVVVLESPESSWELSVSKPPRLTANADPKFIRTNEPTTKG